MKKFVNSGQFKKGQVSLRKGVILSEETKAKIRSARAKQIIPKEIYIANGLKLRGKKHGMWKGVLSSYRAKHEWVERYLGKPKTCSKCRKTGLTGHKIHWANKDHKYKHVLSDWIRLCAKCHGVYDKLNQKY